jgi:hypothetical protein
MKIILRSHTNTAEEIQLGHKLGFTSIKGIEVISATANLNGFTPLSAVLRYLRIDKKLLIKEVHDSNINGRVKIINDYPNLILCPPTRANSGRNRSIEHYIIKTLQICNAENFKTLHFTHYGFINSVFQQNEINRILSILLNPLIYTVLDTLYWEIDSRYLDQMEKSFRDIQECFQHTPVYPEIIIAPMLTYENLTLGNDKSYWQFYGRETKGW